MKPRAAIANPRDSSARPPAPEQTRRLRSTLAKRDRELRILAQVAARIHGEERVDAILDIALEEILRDKQLAAAWVFLGREPELKLHLAAARGVSPGYLEEVRKEGLSECLCPEVFRSGQRMQARNTTQCPRMPTIVEGLDAAACHACIPLRFEGERRGVLNVAARPGEQFSESELRFLETLGHQISLAVERARHLHSERRYNQEARALAALNKSIGGSLHEEAILQAVGDTARETLGAEHVYVLLGSDPRTMRVAYRVGPDPVLRDSRTVDLTAESLVEAVSALSSNQAVVVQDAEIDKRVSTAAWRKRGVRSGVLVPLSTRDRVLGLMALGRSRTHQWTREQVDVAEALAAQASVALENGRLYEEAREAYEGLRDAQAKIIQTEKLAVVGTLASGLAHEVRNPLNSIALQLSLLERRIGRIENGLADEMRDLTGVIREEIRRLDSLVGDFLVFSRTRRLETRPTDVDSLLDEVARLLRPEARSAGVTLRRERRGDVLPPVPMDAEKMKQVVINLIRNALEAMSEGGAITVENGSVDGRARITVRDTGPGIPPGIDIFQLFVTTKARGTGLGLPIVQQIVLEHGGEVTVSSAPGQGAAFTVTLPLSAPEDHIGSGARS
jgi:signal transduction histidine kinase/putative methionine-R-sulfoxide reductase with GAF domain